MDADDLTFRFPITQNGAMGTNLGKNQQNWPIPISSFRMVIAKQIGIWQQQFEKIKWQ